MCAACSVRLRLTLQLSLKGPDPSRCLQAHRQSPSPHHLRKRTRSQGPLLRRRCPASTLVRPCPTPALAVACRDVEAATLALRYSSALVMADPTTGCLGPLSS